MLAARIIITAPSLLSRTTSSDNSYSDCQSLVKNHQPTQSEMRCVSCSVDFRGTPLYLSEPVCVRVISLGVYPRAASPYCPTENLCLEQIAS